MPQLAAVVRGAFWLTNTPVAAQSIQHAHSVFRNGAACSMPAALYALCIRRPVVSNSSMPQTLRSTAASHCMLVCNGQHLQLLTLKAGLVEGKGTLLCPPLYCASSCRRTMWPSSPFGHKPRARLFGCCLRTLHDTYRRDRECPPLTGVKLRAGSGSARESRLTSIPSKPARSGDAALNAYFPDDSTNPDPWPSPPPPPSATPSTSRQITPSDLASTTAAVHPSSASLHCSTVKAPTAAASCSCPHLTCRVRNCSTRWHTCRRMCGPRSRGRRLRPRATAWRRGCASARSRASGGRV